MNRKEKYDIKSAKEVLLLRAGEAYYELGKLHSEKTKQEEKMIAHAVLKVLEKDTGTEEQFIELRGLSYMLQGIVDSLRKMCDSIQKLTYIDDIGEPF